jgi:hypothetical protein
MGIVPFILFHADICVVNSYLASALGSLVVDGVILSHAKSFRRSLLQQEDVYCIYRCREVSKIKRQQY